MRDHRTVPPMLDGPPAGTAAPHPKRGAANNPAILAAAAAQWQVLRASLLDKFPELGEDETALRDTLDGASDALDLVAELAQAATSDEYVVGMLKRQIEDLSERRARFERRAESRRDAAQRMMEAIDVRKVERPEFTAFLRSTPGKLVISDPEALPDYLCRITRAPDRAAIKEALERGERHEGVYMSNGGQTIQVRVR